MLSAAPSSLVHQSLLAQPESLKGNKPMKLLVTADSIHIIDQRAARSGPGGGVVSVQKKSVAGDELWVEDGVVANTLLATGQCVVAPEPDETEETEDGETSGGDGKTETVRIVAESEAGFEEIPAESFDDASMTLFDPDAEGDDPPQATKWEDIDTLSEASRTILADKAAEIDPKEISDDKLLEFLGSTQRTTFARKALVEFFAGDGGS